MFHPPKRLQFDCFSRILSIRRILSKEESTAELTPSQICVYLPMLKAHRHGLVNYGRLGVAGVVGREGRGGVILQNSPQRIVMWREIWGMLNWLVVNSGGG